MFSVGEFCYQYLEQQTGDGYPVVNIRYSGPNDPLPFEHKAVVQQFGEETDIDSIKEWYRRQVTCNSLHESCLKMNYLHISERRAITHFYQESLSSWMEKKLKNPPATATDWWGHIRQDFEQIFKPIFATLKNMFLQNDYHGKLTAHSIKVEYPWPEQPEQLRGVLTDMDSPRVYDTSVVDKQKGDVEALRSIISDVINSFGVVTDIVDVEMFHQLDFLQEKYAHREITPLAIRWGMNPVLFWTIPKQIQFLNTVYWLIYRNGILSNPVYDCVFDSFPPWAFQDNRHPALSRVYNYGVQEHPGQYSANESIVKYYRNCIQHFDYQKAKTANSLSAIHKLFIRHYQIILPSIILTEKICGGRTKNMTAFDKRLFYLYVEGIDI
ncbi:uncharacterized protein LOC107495904 [Arachis duranensis]|uniref:Uncharacterized protein LOC107495904 n=1 Tax=Arachis duranensis TaxID=130453 RepID=A0A9C6TLT5_ARADU|nr:uncharacterized protein LOC107495904 [Arachis duranensis]